MIETPPPPVLRFHPDRQGVARWLNSGWLSILEYLWDEGRERTVKQAWHGAGDDRELTTINTHMTRMVLVGLLRRRKADSIWMYAPTLTRCEFEAMQIDAVLCSIGRDEVARWLASQPKEVGR